MTITNGYTDVATFKARYNVGVSGSATLDPQLEAVIEASSRVVDKECNRVFYVSGSGTARTFTAANEYSVFTDDLISIDTSGLKTDDDADGTFETTWATTDYITEPLNASPITFLYLAPDGDYSFPTTEKGVQITGNWGYATATPKPVTEATLIIAQWLWSERGKGKGGDDIPLAAKALLAPFKRVL